LSVARDLIQLVLRCSRAERAHTVICSLSSFRLSFCASMRSGRSSFVRWLCSFIGLTSCLAALRFAFSGTHRFNRMGSIAPSRRINSSGRCAVALHTIIFRDEREATLQPLQIISRLDTFLQMGGCMNNGAHKFHGVCRLV